jgi:exopolyphosphatase/guanosine-5'-triphosphate,3'-diphosphate pyrophosphatase
VTAAKVAAVDIGTNSVRLLITDARGKELERRMRITRLGQGVDVNGALEPDAIRRTVSVLEEYGALIAGHGVTRVRAAATSAARDAKNRDVFFDAAEHALGARPELLPGEEEARLSFQGATADLDPKMGPFLVVDIGGGSTEFILGSTAPEALVSVDMGCVRMTERHLLTDPPTESELEACFADVRGQLQRVRQVIDVGRVRLMLGLAGTVTTLSALSLGLTLHDPKKTHHLTLTRARVEELFTRLKSATVESRRAMLLEPARAEVIVGGAAVLVTILRELDIAELMVSEADILDGLAASLRTHPPATPVAGKDDGRSTGQT